MYIREAIDSDLDDVLRVESQAFGEEAEAELVRKLLLDPSAQPSLSLIAFANEQAVGHILFTKAHLETENTTSIMILAPLAVIPAFQKQGFGSQLIQEGFKRLTAAGVELVFVLGHPEYYPRHGFIPAHPLGLTPTYSIPPIHHDAWMVKALGGGVIGSVNGRVICANVLNQPEYWRE